MQSGQSHQLLDLPVGTDVVAIGLLHQSRNHPHVLHPFSPLLQRPLVETHHLVDVQQGQTAVAVSISGDAGAIQQ